MGKLQENRSAVLVFLARFILGPMMSSGAVMFGPAVEMRGGIVEAAAAAAAAAIHHDCAVIEMFFGLINATAPPL